MYIRKHPAPPIGRLLRGAVFTTFYHRKVAPKVSAGRKAAGNSQRLAKTGACRGFASKPAPFFNARRCSFLFPHFSQCGDCCALRATMILISFYSVLAGLRPAGSHCENSGSSDGSGASARSDRAQTAQILRDRSASAGGGTRYYSPCLIFWCFWIKTKAQEERKCTTEEIDSPERIPTSRSAASYLRAEGRGTRPRWRASAGGDFNPHGAKVRNISSRIVGFRKAETWPARHVAP